MNKNILGIDLGTSSVKVLQLFSNGTIHKVRKPYTEISLQGWWDAVCQAMTELDLSETVAIGLSSQVGTYIVNGRDIISWNSGIGADEVGEIKEKYPAETFLREISMEHPNIASYPIPRLKYIKENYQPLRFVCQPKDYICQMLTGVCVSDPYSWRGLANLETGAYSRFFLEELGLQAENLPPLTGYNQVAGTTKSLENGLPAGIPVYVGLNDYYASLVGMGIRATEELFDISGTSEHLGILTERPVPGTPLVSGPYITHNVHYGVTSSSGISSQLGQKLLAGGIMDLQKASACKPPIFLPYLKGERAPIWDTDARGVFFGIEENCTPDILAYAVFEGVVFSLYHIYETMGSPKAKTMLVSGGVAVNESMNLLKAEMFGIPVKVLEEYDTSALGAAIVASVGAGWFADLNAAFAHTVRVKATITPTGKYTQWLRKRYALYKELYPSLKNHYKKLKELM